MGVAGWVYPRKALIWVQYAKNEPLTEEDCKLTYDMWMDYLVKNDYMTEKQKPPLHPVHGYTLAKTWSEYLPVADFELLFEKSHLSEGYTNLKSFFRHSKNNLYSVYPLGKVPVEITNKYNLRKYLHANDVAVFNAAYPEPVERVIDVDAGALDGGVDNKPPADPAVTPFDRLKKKMTPRSIAAALDSIDSESANNDDPSEEKIEDTLREPSAKRPRVKTCSSKGNDAK
jgi:hypothetical protein